jgi:hypothetical protein
MKMRRVKQISLLVALPALAVTSLTLMASVSRAQTMGEYGGTVGHAATTTSAAMPEIGSQPQAPQPSGVSNSTQSEEEVRTYEEPAAINHREDENTSSENPNGDDWTQVK